jgi:hypothetical protein
MYKTIFSLVAAVSLLQADTLVLRNGSHLDGTFVGGDSRSVRFAIGSQVNTYPIGDVDSVQFANGNSQSSSNAYPSTPPPPQQQQPPPQQQPAPTESYSAPASAPQGEGPLGVELPAGTSIIVRLIDSVNSDTDRLGQTYRASVDQAVVVNGQTVVPRGADAVAVLTNAQKSGKIEGRTSMTLDLQSVTVDGRKYDIATGGVTQASASRGEKSAKVIGGTAALGAIIGAIAGGGKGAAIGTLAGAGAGTAAQVATSGQHVKIPSETRLTFNLTNPLDM